MGSLQSQVLDTNNLSTWTLRELRRFEVILLFSLIYLVGFYDQSFAAYAGRGAGLIVLVSSVVAFVLSVRLRSPAIAGMLIAAGIFMQVPPVQAIADAGTVAFPGPILGVIFFALVLVLGLVKAIGAFRR